MTKTLHSQLIQLPLDGRLIEVALHELASPSSTILLLHEALGSVSYWKDFPQKLALATGCNVLLYSRPGHGNSEGPLDLRNDGHYLNQINVVIPALLQHFSVDCPVVYGHSEGAGIALLYATTSHPVKALVLESPFVIPTRSAAQVPENMAAVYPGSKLQQRLAHYHQEPDEVFNSWVRWAATLDEEKVFPLRDMLSSITCPVLVLQGANDEFGTTTQLAALQASLADVQHETYANTGHLPHREQTDRLLSRVSQFLTELQPLTSGCNS
jgi:pimeloyl-ACP methyl ester carboxylesterase